MTTITGTHALRHGHRLIVTRTGDYYTAELVHRDGRGQVWTYQTEKQIRKLLDRLKSY